MSQFIQKECIIFDMDEDNKNDVIVSLITKLKEQNKITSIDGFYQNVWEREKISPTSIGYNMGLPHGRTEHVLEPTICFGRLRKKVVWNEKTNDAVSMVILIAVPIQDDNHTHMKILSGLARKLMHEEYRDALLSGDKERVYIVLREGLEEVADES